MMGTLINTAGIVIGGGIGLLVKKGIPEQLDKTATQACSIGIIVMSANGIATTMLTADSAGKLSDNGTLMLIISLILGGLFGELIRLDRKLDNFGINIEEKLGKEGFAKGFITSSMLFCVGAMAIVGSISDGMTGDYSILLVKTMLDSIMAMFFAATLGFGVLFSAVSILIYQGAITICAGFFAPLITPELLGQISMVGYCLVLMLGVDMLGVVKIKTVNYLPAILCPIVYNFIIMLKV